MTRSFRLPLLVATLGVGLVAGRYVGLPTAQGDATAVHTAIPAELTSYRDVVKQVLPAVVSIESKVKPKKAESTTGRRTRPQAETPQIPEEFRRLFPDLPRMQPDATPREQVLGFGSGFIVDPEGVIVTNNHVVDGASEVVVSLTDGRKFTSSDIKTDETSDLAIVRIKANGPLPFVKFGDSSQAEIGDRVLAVGAPFGFTGSVTHGIVSGKGRDLQMNRYDDFLQTDAAINPGNSGGPLVNLAGEVIGVNSVIKSRSGGFEGIGMAITSNTAQNVVKQLETNGTVKRGYLGIEMSQRVSEEVAARLGMKDDHGVVVARVVPNSPAAKAGVKADDVITALNGHQVVDNRALLRAVGSLPIGKAADLQVLRDGHTQKLTLTLEEQPKGYGERTIPTRGARTEGETTRVEKFGLELSDLPEDRAEAFGVKAGALVVGVEPDSAAAEAGIARGVVITKVDHKDVKSADAAKQAIEKGDAAKGILLHLRSADGGTSILLLKAEKK